MPSEINISGRKEQNVKKRRNIAENAQIFKNRQILIYAKEIYPCD